MIMTVISNVLKDAGTSLENVVKCNVYLTNMADFGAMNEAYLEFFPDPAVLPVSSYIILGFILVM
jgi:2-iminobutanoate/2-iminopropanoate deaminase